MNQPEHPDIHNLPDFLQRHTNPEIFELQVDSLMSALGADQSIIEAYKRSFGIHRSGIPGYDSKVQSEDVRLKQSSMAQYADSLAKLSDFEQDGPQKAWKNEQPTARYLNGVTAQVKRVTPVALEAGSLAAPMDLLTFNYLPESDLNRELSVRIISNEDARLLWGPQASGGQFPVMDIIARMDELGMRDLSHERLNSRFENTASLMQFEGGRVFIEALALFTELSQHRPKRFQQAIRLKERHFDSLGAADLEAKIAMLTDIANLCRNHQQSPEKVPIKAIEEMSRHSIRQIGSNLNTFRAIYQNVGAPLHHELVPRKTAGRAAVKSSILPPKTELSPIQLTQMAAARQRIVQAEADKSENPYGLPTSEDSAETIVSLEEGLQKVAEWIRLDPALADSYHPMRNEIHRTGLPDFDAKYIEEGYAIKVLTVGKALTQLSELANFATGKSISPLSREDILYLRQGVEAGILQIGSLIVPTEMDMLTYFGAAGAESADIALSPNDIRILFGIESGGEEISQSRISSTMEEKGLLDHSQESLDARFRHALDVMQVDLSLELVNTLYYLAKLPHSNDALAHAVRLNIIETFPELGKNDIIQKLQRLVKFSKALDHPGGNQSADSILNLLKKRSLSSRSHMVGIAGGYISAYNNFGYEVPADLIRRYGILFNPNSLAEIPTPEQPDRQHELQEQYTSLMARFESQIEPWRFSQIPKKERKQFSELQRQLVIGYTSGAQQQVGGIPKEDAQQLVGTLVRLQKLGSAETLPEGQEKLAQSLLGLREISDQFEELRRAAQQNRVQTPLVIPDTLFVERQCEDIRRSWAIYKELITTTWPDDKGNQVATAIGRLLFEISDTVPQEELPADITETAELLNTVVLPPRPTAEEVTREFQRQGFQRQLSPVKNQRIRDLAAVRDEYDGKMYFTDKILSGQPAKSSQEQEESLHELTDDSIKTPLKIRSKSYCVVVIEIDGETYAIAEPLFRERATYVVAEAQAPGTWLEMLKMHKDDARALGAFRIPHTKALYGEDHIHTIIETILNLHSRRLTLE